MEVLTFNFDSITLHLKQTNKRKVKEHIHTHIRMFSISVYLQGCAGPSCVCVYESNLKYTSLVIFKTHSSLTALDNFNMSLIKVQLQIKCISKPAALTVVMD